MPYDRKHFFDTVRASLFSGSLTQDQVDGMNYLLSTWENHFEKNNPRDGTNWLSYALATFYHETAARMKPIEEYGKGSGKPYGTATGPYNKKYYGRGHVQLTWEENYKKATGYLKDRYRITADLHKQPEQMLEDEISALVSYDGMVNGWFTGVGLPKYFNATAEDSYNARRIVNVLDKAELIQGYYNKFKKSLKFEQPPTVTPEEPPKEEAPMEKPEEVINITLSSDKPVRLNVIAGPNVEIE